MLKHGVVHQMNQLGGNVLKPKVSFLCTKCNEQAQYFPNQKWCPLSLCQGRLIRTDRCLICELDRADPDTGKCGYCVKILEFLVPLLEIRCEAKNGGWPQVKPDDVVMLRQVILAVVMAKWGRDPDGDLPIETKVVDRTRYRSLTQAPLLYEHRAETMTRLFGILDLASLNVASSIDAYRSIMQEVDTRLGDFEADNEAIMRMPLFAPDEADER